MKEHNIYWKEVFRQPLSFLRVLFGTIWYGSWQLSYEIETERALFPKAYKIRKIKRLKQ
jgi:hypothetical protein